MAQQKKLADFMELKRLMDAGMSNKQIADRYSVTREAVRQAFAKHEIRNSPERTRHAKHLPWRVRSDHTDDMLAKRLRAYSKRQQNQPLAARDERLLDEWVSYMDGNNWTSVPLSVHYDRADADGFWLEPRSPEDTDYVHPPPNPRPW